MLESESASEIVDANSQQTAIKAKRFMLSIDSNLFDPSSKERRNIKEACAIAGIKIRGRAYDVIRLRNGLTKDAFVKSGLLKDKLQDFVFVELKGTKGMSRIGDNFENFFFGITASEQALAETLGPDRYEFILVNIFKERHLKVTLTDLLVRSEGRQYPTLNIQLGPVIENQRLSET